MAKRSEQQHSANARQKSFFRFSFFAGMTHMVDFGQRLHAYRQLLANEHYDYQVLASDWQALGFDMQYSISILSVLWLLIETKALAAQTAKASACAVSSVA